VSFRSRRQTGSNTRPLHLPNRAKNVTLPGRSQLAQRGIASYAILREMLKMRCPKTRLRDKEASDNGTVREIQGDLSKDTDRSVKVLKRLQTDELIGEGGGMQYAEQRGPRSDIG